LGWEKEKSGVEKGGRNHGDVEAEKGIAQMRYEKKRVLAKERQNE
jgi:hypothetical protein